ncbi:MAG: PAS domain-containing protein [Chitinivibrionales bacterium]|nr:PAS domain-containing protein [Chitinivibrionales bacterium]
MKIDEILTQVALPDDVAHRLRSYCKTLEENEARAWQHYVTCSHLLEHLDCAYHCTTSDGVLIDLNVQWTTLFGYASADVLGKNFSHFIHSDSKLLLQPILKLLMRGETIHNREIKMVRSDGCIIDTALTAKTSKHAGTTLFHFIVYDITKRKKAERALIESELTVINLLQGIADGVFLLTNQTIGWTNDLFAKLVEYSTEEIYGMALSELFDNDLSYQKVTSLFNKNSTHYEAIEVRMKTKYGRFVDALLKISAISMKQFPDSFIVTVIDISHYKLNQTQHVPQQALIRVAEHDETIGSLM